MKQSDIWMQPIVDEYDMLKEREVYELVPRLADRNVVDSKWVFVVKWGEDGGIEKRKAHIIAKGYTQMIGEDYQETYVSVARLESIQLICTIAAAKRLRLWQVDFVSAFLNSNSTYEVFMEQPKRFEEGNQDMVWKLKCYIGQCRVLMTGPKTSIEHLRDMNTIDHMQMLRLGLGYLEKNSH